MTNNYYEQHHDHTPLSDVCMTVALAVTIVTLIKLLMYGLTYVSLAWLSITLLYVLFTVISNPHSVIRKVFNVSYLFISFIAIYAVFLYDNPILPKSESHLKADVEDDEIKNDIDNNSEVIIETPKPVAVEIDNIVKEDESTFEEIDLSDNLNNDDNYTSNKINIDENTTDNTVINDINLNSNSSLNENSIDINLDESSEQNNY